MKKNFTFLIMMALSQIASAQCTTNNATTCVCADGSTDCDLLPDIQVGHNEFYTTGTYGLDETAGRLYLTVTTPNVGHGPLEVRTTTTFVCGTDTFTGTAPSICPDGITFPKQLITQRVFHKTGNAMSFYDRMAGTMTYHPSHGHMHVDDWGIFTIRQQTTDPNPLNWPILADGKKLAFCLMDLGTCNDYLGDCLDTLGGTLQNNDFPNFGLGGGGYNCSSVVQGISSGYCDSYWTTLDGMWIDIPAGFCNGTYYLVAQVDPYNYFLEEHDLDNVYAAPITLTQQSSTMTAAVSAAGTTTFCAGGSVVLNASYGNSYLWSNGDTSASIAVTAAGTYSVTITGQCGVATSAPITVNVINAADPVVSPDTICVNQTATLTATASGIINWYDAPTAGNLLFTGGVYITQPLAATTNYYAENVETIAGAINYSTPHDNTIGGGGYLNSQQHLIFDVYAPVALVSVLVYVNTGGNKTVELRNSAGSVLQSAVINFPAGQSRITLNFNIAPGNDYQLGFDPNSTVDLYRNNAGVSYPYDISGITSIKNSSGGNNRYYWFYDWEVHEQDVNCISNRSQAEAFVDQCLSLSDKGVAQMQIIPNPAEDYLFITTKNISAASAEVLIYDLAGKMVMNAIIVISPAENKLDISSLAKGVYFVELNAAGKMLKEKITVN